MTDDLTTRLREISRLPLAREALARIEALEAENAEYARFWGQNLVPALAARDAVIAETLARHRRVEHPSGDYCVTCGGIAWPCPDAAILSRVPQGTASQWSGNRAFAADEVLAQGAAEPSDSARAQLEKLVREYLPRDAGRILAEYDAEEGAK